MKITAGKREDIMREREEYDARVAKQQEEYKEQYDEYRHAKGMVLFGVEEEVRSQLSVIDLDFDIDAREGDTYYKEDKDFATAIEIRIEVHERGKFSEYAALAWDYTITLDKNGDVKKESSSWSGLKAVTAEQLEDLKKSVNAIELIQNMDWRTILSKELPAYSEYVTTREPRRQDRPNFEQQLMEVEIEELVGARKLVKGKSGRYSVYYGIIKETPKKYQVFDISEYLIQGSDSIEHLVERASDFATTVSKDKFIASLDKPLEIIEY